MSEQTTTEPTETTEPEPQEGEKSYDAAYVKKLREEAAKYRTEATANAKAAQRLAEIEEANKTEAQKVADQLAAAQRDAETARADALRFRIAAKFQVSDEDTDLFLTGTDEETLTKQAQRLMDRTTTAHKGGNVVPREGTSAPAKDDEIREFTSRLFSKQ